MKMDAFEEVDYVLMRFSTVEPALKSLYVKWLAMKVIKQYHIDVWGAVPKEDVEEDALIEDYVRLAPLNYMWVSSHLREDLHPIKARKLTKKKERFDFMFRPERNGIDVNNSKHQGWGTKAYLNLFAKVDHALQEKDADLHRHLYPYMRNIFNWYCWTIPCANGYTWWSREKGTGVKNWMVFDVNGESVDPWKVHGVAVDELNLICRDKDIRRDQLWRLDANEFHEMASYLRPGEVSVMGQHHYRHYNLDD
jgi:hypothetical protein